MIDKIVERCAITETFRFLFNRLFVSSFFFCFLHVSIICSLNKITTWLDKSLIGNEAIAIKIINRVRRKEKKRKGKESRK